MVNWWSRGKVSDFCARVRGSILDTPTNVSELETNVKHLEFDKSINEPDSPGNVSAGESNLFGCPMCCEKQFSLMDLQQHISRYIWGSLKCPVCDEVCVGLEILAVHLDEHHSDQEMTLSENSLLTNVAKSTVSSEESVNISCGDVRDQVIKHQTNILTEVEVDKERITVDKSVNHNKNTGGSEKQDMEICVPLKNNITSPCNTFSSKNISNRSKFVKKTDINVSSVVKQTSLAYKTRSLRHRPRLLIKNITDLQTPNVSSTSLEKTLKPQFSDEVPIDIMKRYTHNSGITKTSFVPVTNILDNKQRLITNWCENCKNVSTSSQKTETRVGATHCMDSNCEICFHKCGISFISERPCV
uniref:(California timema) hypothetical protein n=1 Tax=Timema californicum TaxID=61474 RepID=A0A7R9PDR1_TIMCA|nr:unnamed protein product [Timema californicum]